jgi:hypothetical protein
MSHIRLGDTLKKFVGKEVVLCTKLTGDVHFVYKGKLKDVRYERNSGYVTLTDYSMSKSSQREGVFDIIRNASLLERKLGEVDVGLGEIYYSFPWENMLRHI